MGCATQNDASILRDYLITWGSASAQLTLPPRPGSTRARVLVSTFSGENCNFGTSSPRDGWASILQDSTVVKALASANREVAFLPSWFTRIETRRGEFGTGGDISQGDFNVSQHILLSLLLTSPIVEQWLAHRRHRRQLGSRFIPLTIQHWSPIHDISRSLVFYGLSSLRSIMNAY